MKVRFHKRFVIEFERLDAKIQQAFEKRLQIFFTDPFDVKLNNHPLRGRWLRYRSINISGDFRAIYKEISADEVLFATIGTHSQLYR